MDNFDNWVWITHGYYRYAVCAGVCYEICVIRHNKGDSILNANANLYLAGDWMNYAKDEYYFERELLCENKTVQELVKYAKDDFDKNMR